MLQSIDSSIGDLDYLIQCNEGSLVNLIEANEFFWVFSALWDNFFHGVLEYVYNYVT